MSEKSSPPRRPAVEWAVGIASSVVVVVLVGFLVWRAAFGDDEPARFVTFIEGVDVTPEGTLLRVAIANGGDTAAAGLTLRAGLEGADAAPKSITFDHLAARSIRRGTFVYTDPIRPEDVMLTIDGFTEP